MWVVIGQKAMNPYMLLSQRPEIQHVGCGYHKRRGDQAGNVQLPVQQHLAETQMVHEQPPPGIYRIGEPAVSQ
jgi:hypothetical protein